MQLDHELVVGAGHQLELARVPTRTAFTPSLPTAIACWSTATVLGRSITTRAGEASVLSFGVTGPRAVNSTLIPSSLRTTFSRSSAACVASVLCVCAATVTRTRTGSARTIASHCFRISLLPHTRWPSAQPVSFFKLASRLNFANLYRRRRDPFHHVLGERLA
jgi:hypothetical protein